MKVPLKFARSTCARRTTSACAPTRIEWAEPANVVTFATRVLSVVSSLNSAS